MNGTLIAVVTALAGGGALAALLTYVGLRRTTSGQVATSDAATLWAESQAMRTELREEVRRLREDIAAMAGEVRDLKVELSALRARLRRYEATNGATDV